MKKTHNREKIEMAKFNSDFWEVQAGPEYLESVSSERALWFETDMDRDRRHATREFFGEVMPSVTAIIDEQLTNRQREVLRLYYFEGKTQEDIATILDLTQSTVSRHLFGTVRNGKKVGGAIPKLRKAVNRTADPVIHGALATLQARFAQTAA